MVVRGVPPVLSRLTDTRARLEHAVQNAPTALGRRFLERRLREVCEQEKLVHSWLAGPYDPPPAPDRSQSS